MNAVNWQQRLLHVLALIARSPERTTVYRRVETPAGLEVVRLVTTPKHPCGIEYRDVLDPHAVTFDLIVDRTWGPRLRKRVAAMVAAGLTRDEAAARIHGQLQSIIAATARS